MNKIITSSLIVLLPLVAMAKKPVVYEKATKVCPAYNNMKHTTNANNIKLEVGKEYRILQKSKGQILTLVEGERIAQRWVDEACFSEMKIAEKSSPSKKVIADKKTSSDTKALASKSTEGDKYPAFSKSKSKQNLLALSWQNAFCQTHQYKKECKSMTKKDFAASHFVLHGLWPQPRNNQYCNVSKKEVGKDKNKQWNRLENLDLNKTVRSELAVLMPGYSSNLHKHEWVKHGSCYGTTENAYYADAMNMLTQFNDSEVGAFFEKNIAKVVYLKDIRSEFEKSFGKGSGDHLTMNCKKGLITELWVHLGSDEENLKALLKKGETPKSRCVKGRIDAVGF